MLDQLFLTRPFQFGVLHAEGFAERFARDISERQVLFFSESAGDTSGVAEGHHRAGESATRGGDGAEARTATGDQKVIDSLGPQAAVGNAVGFAQFDASPTLAMPIHGMIGERDDIGVSLATDAFQDIMLGEDTFADYAHSLAHTERRGDP